MSGKPKKRRVLVTPELPTGIVAHPRYGRTSKPSKYQPSDAEHRVLSRMLPGTFWPASAMPAGMPADRYGATLVYVDRLCRCVDCLRPFIFFAAEQRHWVQALGFHPDSTAVRCTDCRRSVRHVNARRDRIAAVMRDLKDRPGALTRDVLSDEALTSLASDLLALIEVRANKKLDMLKRLRRAMLDRMERDASDGFAALVRRIDTIAGPTKRSDLHGAGANMQT